MQKVQPSSQPSCTLTKARLCSIISVIGTSRKVVASETGDTAIRTAAVPDASASATTAARSAAPMTSETPGSAAISSGARCA